MTWFACDVIVSLYLQDLCEATTKRCDIILERITDLVNECGHYNKASDQMEKNVEQMQEEIAEQQWVIGNTQNVQPIRCKKQIP